MSHATQNMLWLRVLNHLAFSKILTCRISRYINDKHPQNIIIYHVLQVQGNVDHKDPLNIQGRYDLGRVFFT